MVTVARADDERVQVPSGDELGSGAATQRRAVLAVAAAVLSVVAAVVAAVGPAHGKHSVYAWPPAAIPAKSPRLGWYAPLALLNRVPASIDVRLPCGLSPPLRNGPTTILATSRRSQRSGALEIVMERHSLRFRAGATEVSSAPWPASCPLDVAVQGGQLRLRGSAFPLDLGTPGDMPIVTSLFTRLDIRHGEPPRVLLRTRDYATSETSRQIVAALLAVVLAVAALILAAGTRRPRKVTATLPRGLRSAWAARHPADAVVLGVLLLWWIVSPTFSDDGWVIERLVNYANAGGFSLYYDEFGANQPLGYWLDWSEHFLAAHGLLVLRLPALACLLASWFLCRRLLVRSLPLRRSADALELWALSGAFLVGGVAWSMTLRPEPVIALLALIALSAMVSFSRSPRFAPLAIAVSASALALTAHTAGIVATAPLVAGTPAVVRAVRRGRSIWLPALGGVLIAGVALSLVLFTLDADLMTRLADAHLVREGGLHSEPPWRDWTRYTRFEVRGGGTGVRRLSLALLALSAVAVFTRLRSIRTGISPLPAYSVAVAFVLLAFVPSKWPWHFGALAGIGAVAIAAEAARLTAEGRTRHAGRDRVLIALTALLGATLWAWTRVRPWTLLDLQKLDWADGFNAFSLFLTGALFAYLVLRNRRKSPRSATGVFVAVVPLCAIALTLAIVVVDAIVAPWTLTRQNVASLLRRPTCGVADEFPTGPVLVARLRDGSSGSMIAPSVLPYFPCATLATSERGRIVVPRTVVTALTHWPFSQRDSPLEAATDLYEFRRIDHGRLISVYSGSTVIAGFGRIDAKAQSAG